MAEEIFISALTGLIITLALCGIVIIVMCIMEWELPSKDMFPSIHKDKMVMLRLFIMFFVSMSVMAYYLPFSNITL